MMTKTPFYYYVLSYQYEGETRRRTHTSCYFLSYEDCHMHMTQMIDSEMYCKRSELLAFDVQSVMLDPTHVSSSEVFGF